MSLRTRFLIGLLALVALAAPAFARTYSDVSDAHKHYEAIIALTDEGTVKGYPNGEFHPEGLINRAEAVKVLAESSFSDSAIKSSINWHKLNKHQYVMFPDVPIWEWYGQYVEIAYQNGIIQGYPDGNFRPADHINFAEALKVILEAYDADFTQNRYQPNKLLHIKQGEWFEKYFTYAYQHNLINRNKFYHPAQLITRGEFVEIIYRLETVQRKKLVRYTENKEPTSTEYKITIPKLDIVNVDVSFASVYDASEALSILKNGLGNYLNPPDSNKKLLLFGHSSGYSWDNSNYKTILREINKLQNGDRIYINYKETGYVYEIYGSEVIPASQDHVLVENENVHELALYTCWPPNSIRQRYVVFGKPV